MTISYDGFKTLKVERQGRILKTYFNRPDALNAINRMAHSELVQFFSVISQDPECDVLILSGAGRAFSAGGDFEHMQEMVDHPSLFLDDIPDIKRLIFGLLDCPKPIIAKLNGAAIGLGATIALFCDVVFAASSAKIGDPHVRIGLTAGDGGAVIWPHLIGHARAKEILFTGRSLLGDEAARIGLINRAVPAEELDRVVDEYAAELLTLPRRALQWTKISINIGLKQLVHAVLDASVAYEALSNATHDHQEAVSALREHRKPNYTGN